MAVIRGSISGYDGGGHTATIRIDGSAPQTLEGIAVSHGIDGGEMTAGRRVIVDTGESGEVEELVVIAVFG